MGTDIGTDIGTMCIVCQTTISKDEEVWRCEKCQCTFHKECWEENGGCATYGCENAPKAQKKPQSVATADSYWGATTKNCPLCGEIIPISATQCNHCHETFDTAIPMTRSQILEKQKPEKLTTNKKAVALAVFICSLLGCIAPFTLFFGGLWFKDNKKFLREESPALYLLTVIGLITSIVYTCLILALIIF